MRNISLVTEFILLGIPHTDDLETMLFVLFLSFYIFILMGNLLILLVIVSSAWLHTPMYFFLCKLSVCDIFFPSVSSPKMLFYLSGNSRAISYAGCVSQLFFYHFLGCTECFLYMVMAYDRFVAICYPLRYTIIMSHRVCAILAMGTSFFGCIQATFLTTLTFQLPYCGPNEVDYYFCNIPGMLKLACADTSALEMVGFIIFIVVGINIIVPSFTIFVSYYLILTNILQIKSMEGRSKAFSTCTSHIIAVSLFFGSMSFMYLKPSSAGSMDTEKISSVFYTNVVAMMNPLIYSLRNKDVKTALRKTLSRR
ncbi:unnamed protein product [Rangifer tarandus platyrhynchus]|uniref:G-protein coupled receptors family 1 profile domain-containing protein n=1 Tax=Rangifer tarandus platyrhynchus TaxID=3082113 RepID=A0ABN8YZ55_RANTA|nr:unnamed protein product [Rangifer tarandus platyrhynchus]